MTSERAVNADSFVKSAHSQVAKQPPPGPLSGQQQLRGVAKLGPIQNPVPHREYWGKGEHF